MSLTERLDFKKNMYRDYRALRKRSPRLRDSVRGSKLIVLEPT